MTVSGPDYMPILEGAIMALLVAGVFAYPIYRILLALKSRQIVSQFVPEHAAKMGTPTMGGIITVVGFLGACAALVPVLSRVTSGLGGRPQIAIPLLCLTFALIGFVDDFVIPRLMKGKRGLGWTQKLAMQIVFAFVSVWMMGPNPSGLQIGVTIFLILFFSNAYNFADGMDWLAGLILLGMTFGYAWIGLRAGAVGAVAYLVVLAVASLPFLVLNKPKAKIFMGDVGALPIGAVVGLLVAAIAMPTLAPALRIYGSTPDQPFVPTSTIPAGTIVGLCIVSLMMVAELVPVPLQILSVKLRHGKRLFLMTPIHHGYQKRGWKETRVVALFVGWQVVFSLLGVGAAAAIDNYATNVKKTRAVENSRRLMTTLEAYREQ